MNNTKPIIIKPENKDRVMAAFAAAQGRATARTVDSYAQLERIIDGINNRLSGISKKALAGTIVYYDFRQYFPSAYNFTPSSTHFKMDYKNGAWRLLWVDRMTCPNRRSDYDYELRLSESAKAAVLKLYE